MKVEISNLLASVLIRVLQEEAMQQAIWLHQERADDTPKEFLEERERIIDELINLKEELRNYEQQQQ